MKTEFNIGQQVWVICDNEVEVLKVAEINIRSNICYKFRTLDGISLSTWYREEFVGATKEELKNKLFK